MKRCQPWLGTYVEIRAEGLDEPRLNAAIDKAFAAIREVHQLMSFHDSQSELSRLNQEAHLRAIQVHPWTYQVLQQGLEVHEATDGLFDCAIAPNLIKHGQLPRFTDLHKHTGSMGDIRLRSDGYVSFDRPLALDLGGIAKGFAVDRAIDVLKEMGVARAVVNAGGDLRVLGDTAEPVQVRDPRDPNALICIGQIANGAVATSASYFMRSHEDNTTASALIDPRSSAPIAAEASYTIVAETCLVADALTKPLAIECDPQAAYLKKFNAQGIIV